jgi:hypothetical protein
MAAILDCYLNVTMYLCIIKDIIDSWLNICDGGHWLDVDEKSG